MTLELFFRLTSLLMVMFRHFFLSPHCQMKSVNDDSNPRTRRLPIHPLSSGFSDAARAQGSWKNQCGMTKA
jgi:hypothetical protein